MPSTVAALSLLCSLFALSLSQSTTPYIPEVFVGKCYERNPIGTNCSTLWSTFSQAATLSNAVVTDADYVPFFSIANFSTPKDGILFWSGNQAFALAISNSDNRLFTTLEGTSSGYVLNGLNWCGLPNASSPAFDFTDPCLYPKNSTYYGTEGVWEQCSRHFAEGAAGKVTILLQPAQLNYNSGPYLAYRNTSIFARVELPSIVEAQVEAITILLLANYTLAPGEKCGNGSLLSLANEVKQKFGYSPTCIDDPRKIYEILCPSEETNTPECIAARLSRSEASSSPSSKESMYLIWALVTTVTTAASIVLAVYFVVRLRSSKSYSEL